MTSLMAALACSAPADTPRPLASPGAQSRDGASRGIDRPGGIGTGARKLVPAPRSAAGTRTVSRTVAVSVRVVPADRRVTTFALAQNTPNPFHGTTSIRYAVPKRAVCSVRIYNVLGQRVATLVRGTLDPGEYAVQWNGTDDNGVRLKAGVYFCRMDVGSFSQSRKLICQ